MKTSINSAMMKQAVSKTMIVATILLALCPFAGIARMSGQQTLPPKIRSYLNRNYPDWKLSGVAIGCDRDFRRSLIAGDFDGDGRQDVTVKIVSRNKGYIITFLNRGSDYRAHELESGSQAEMRRQGLTVSRKGETYSEIVNDNFDRVTRRLRHDAPVGGTCEASAYLYIYQNGSFRRAFVSD